MTIYKNNLSLKLRLFFIIYFVFVYGVATLTELFEIVFDTFKAADVVPDDTELPPLAVVLLLPIPNALIKESDLVTFVAEVIVVP